MSRMTPRQRARALSERVDQLVAARRWKRKARLLRRHPELLGDDALHLLERGGSEVRLLHVALLRRARVVGVTRAVAEIRTAVEELPGLVAAGNAALARYRTDGRTPDLDASIAAFETADVCAVPGYLDRSVVLANLAIALKDRFEAGGNEADLRRARAVGEEAVILAAEQPGRRAALVNLASVLLVRYQAERADPDVRRAVVLAEQAAALSTSADVDRAAVLTVLGDARLHSYRLTRRRTELEAAVAALGEAVALDDSPRERSNLGVALSERHLATGSVDDLERAIALLTTAVQDTPPRAPERPWRLANLGGALAERYERRGDRRDLDAAINAFDEATSAYRPGPDGLDWQYNLALGLRDRYARDGYLPDLDRAVQLLEPIVAVVAGPRVRADRLDQLAGTLRIRALRRGDGAELARAVELHRTAATSVPASERVMLLNNLAGTLRAWAGAGGGRRALDEAVQAYRDAVASSSSDDAAYPTVLANLGNGLVDLYDTTGETDRLNEAIALYTASVEATDPRSPDLPARLHNRARALQRRHGRSGDPSDRDAATAEYREACRTADGAVAEVGLRCGLGWGGWAAAQGMWREAVEAFDNAVASADLLERRQVRRTDREVWLRAVAEAPATSAYVYCRLGEPASALTRLEWGRARLLADALALARLDLDALDRVRPDLAERYRAAADHLRAATAPAAQRSVGHHDGCVPGIGAVAGGTSGRGGRGRGGVCE